MPEWTNIYCKITQKTFFVAIAHNTSASLSYTSFSIFYHNKFEFWFSIFELVLSRMSHAGPKKML